MRSVGPAGRAGLGALLCVVAVPASAQQQLTATEISTGVICAWSSHDFVGAAFGVARRLDSQTRVTAIAAPGVLGSSVAVRLEVGAQLIVNPSGRGGTGLYAGAGLAWQGATGMHGGSYITALLGLESAPGARFGWYGELGLGGGVRLGLGLRWRRFPPWWR